MFGFPENVRDFCQRPWHDPPRRDERSSATPPRPIGITLPCMFMRHKRGNAVFGAEFQVQCGIRQIAQHRAGGRIFARAATVERGVAHDIAADKHGVKHVVDARQHVAIRNQRGVDRDLDARGLAALAFPFFIPLRSTSVEPPPAKSLIIPSSLIV